MLVTLSVRVCYVPVLGSTVELAHDLRCAGQPMIPYYNVVWPPGRIAIVNIDHNIGYTRLASHRSFDPHAELSADNVRHRVEGHLHCHLTESEVSSLTDGI